MYYMHPTQYDGGGGDSRQQQRQPEQYKCRGDGNDENTKGWQSAFRTNEIKRLVSLPSSSTSDSTTESPYPTTKISTSPYPSIAPPFDPNRFPNTQSDPNHISLYRPYVGAANDYRGNINNGLQYVSHENKSRGNYPGSDFEGYPERNTTSVPNSNNASIIQTNTMNSPLMQHANMTLWLDPQKPTQQMRRTDDVPFTLPGFSDNIKNQIVRDPMKQTSSGDLRSNTPAGTGTPLVKPDPVGMKNASALHQFRDGSSGFLESKVIQHNRLFVGATGKPCANNRSVAGIFYGKSPTSGVAHPELISHVTGSSIQSTQSLQPKSEGNYQINTNEDFVAGYNQQIDKSSYSVVAHPTRFREEKVTSDNAIEDRLSSQILSSPISSVPNLSTGTQYTKYDDVDKTKVEYNLLSYTKPLLSRKATESPVIVTVTNECTNTLVAFSPKKVSWHHSNEVSDLDISPSEGSMINLYASVSTPRKFDFSACDYNEACEAAKMLQFLHVHSPSNESVAEVNKMSTDFWKNDTRPSILQPESTIDVSFDPVETIDTNALEREKIESEKLELEIQSKPNRRGKIGKRIKDEPELDKSSGPPESQSNAPPVPSTDLRNKLPPWQKLIKRNNKVARIEDRDELFIPEGEDGEDDAAGKSTNMKDKDFIAKARASIDPSFDALFVAMAQMIPCELNADDQNSAITSYKNHEIGFAGLCCRHCGGRPGSGRYFPNSVRSLSQTTTAHNMIKHFVNASNIVPDEESNLDDTSDESDSSSLDNNESDSNTRLEFTKKGKVQRIGGKHCTNCPYSVWLWLTEFQRRLTEGKTGDDGKEFGSEGPSQQEGGGQRVRYGARKIFYNRVWKRMNKVIEQRRYQRENRNDVNVHPSMLDDEDSESRDFSNRNKPFQLDHSEDSPKNPKNQPKRKRHDSEISAPSSKLKKKVKHSKRKQSLGNLPPPSTSTKNDITFLDLTTTEHALHSTSATSPRQMNREYTIDSTSTASSGGSFINQNQPRKHQWEV